MLDSKKIAAAVAAGVLGGFALVGVGAVQAFADDGAGKCVDDGRGQVRCEYVKKHHLVTDTLEYLGVVKRTTVQKCPQGQTKCGGVDSSDSSDSSDVPDKQKS